MSSTARILLWLLLATAACGSPTVSPAAGDADGRGDLGSSPLADGSTDAARDAAAAAADNSGASTGDASAPDLAAPLMPIDLGATPADLVSIADLAPLHDLAAPKDLAPPHDLAAPPDLLPPFVPILGVHTPLPIDPDVSVLDGQWLLDLYRVLLGRDHDVTGYKSNFGLLQGTATRNQIHAAFTASSEFQKNPSLKDRSAFVTRLYQTLLGRAPSQAEVAAQVARLCAYDGSACPQNGVTWPQMIEAFYASAEYKSKRCDPSVYTLGGPVTPGKYLLGDLFTGKARLQTIAESQEVHLGLPSALNGAIWDQKLPIIVDPAGSGRLYGFTRVVRTQQQQFTIVLVTSTDGVSFTEVGPIFDRSGTETYYDPHVTIDRGLCPTRYVMAMECLGSYGGASLCTSQTSTPTLPETWSRPAVVVDGCPGGGACGTPAAQSASTGVTLVDGQSRYVSWTQVYDGVVANDSHAHTYSQGFAVPSFAAYEGNTFKPKQPLTTLLSAEPNVACNSVWDCNNRDKQDWKKEGSYFYAIYNGANYYRCSGSNGNGAGINRWGLSVARSKSAVGGEYTDRLPQGRVVFAERTDVCGISYPMVNVIGGELYVYYAYYPKGGGNRTMRARLVSP